MATGTIHRQYFCHMLGKDVQGDDHAVLRPQIEEASAQWHSGDRGMAGPLFETIVHREWARHVPHRLSPHDHPYLSSLLHTYHVGLVLTST